MRQITVEEVDREHASLKQERLTLMEERDCLERTCLVLFSRDPQIELKRIRYEVVDRRISEINARLKKIPKLRIIANLQAANRGQANAN